MSNMFNMIVLSLTQLLANKTQGTEGRGCIDNVLPVIFDKQCDKNLLLTYIARAPDRAENNR